jgi:hypothetical protein
MSAPPALLPPELPKAQTLVCANCGAELDGEYCAGCGQRHEPHIHTVAHFAGEALESISHADSRLWQTLWLLFARPGFLTREFFAGRRARYLPPFRLYLVLSVIFFVITTLPDSSPTEAAATWGKATSDRKQTAAQDQAGEASQAEVAEVTAAAEAGDIAKLAEIAARHQAPAAANAGVEDAIVEVEGFKEFCNAFKTPETGGSGRAARENIRKFCQRAQDDGSELGAALVRNLPRAMFIFLPVLAGIMKLMYWRPKRYYVEHLLFLVHTHAAVFLVFSLVALYSFIPVLGDATPFAFFIALAYMAWYIYRAMGNVYEQRGALTFLKYVFLFWVYVITAAVTLLLTLIFSAIAG